MQIRLPVIAKSKETGTELVSAIDAEIQESTADLLVARHHAVSTEYVLSEGSIWRCLHAGFPAALNNMPRLKRSAIDRFSEDVDASFRYARRHGCFGAFENLRSVYRHLGRDANGNINEPGAIVVQSDHPEMIDAIEAAKKTLERLRCIDDVIYISSLGPTISIMPTAAVDRPFAVGVHNPHSTPWPGSLYGISEAEQIVADLHEKTPGRMDIDSQRMKGILSEIEILEPDFLPQSHIENTRLENVGWWMLTPLSRRALGETSVDDVGDFVALHSLLNDRARSIGAIPKGNINPFDGNDVIRSSPQILSELLINITPTYQASVTPLKSGDILEIFLEKVLLRPVQDQMRSIGYNSL